MWKSLLQYLGVLGMALCIQSCKDTKDNEVTDPLFKTLTGKETGIEFSNNLSYSPSFNLFKYIYFYNGSGVGAGDFNNDGLTDIFFGSNQGDNKLYLNEGNMRFRDVSKAAGIPVDGGWSTGISVVDINNDGLLDIYVCRVGDYEVLHSKNQLLVNEGAGADGVPRFSDKAAEFGLDFSGFSTQAAFFDYDLDGDLDMFLMNHSVHQNGTFKPRAEFTGSYHARSGDRIYRNDGGKFSDVTKETGINSSAIGYGLGIVIADINLDGYPDIYIGNDFHENDYLYINQRNGTFTDESTTALMHMSQYSMGVDVADVNNDAFPEIISMDMLPEDPYILKRSLGEDAYDIFFNKISIGYAYQYTRNNLQYNRRNGLFSETGLYSGIAATDWSWAPLWMDFDNDGRKDLFISNGIPKRMNDIDYVNFVSNTAEVSQRLNMDTGSSKDLSLIKKFPEIKLPNKFYRNSGEMNFIDETSRIAGAMPSFSNGAAYADLDNDGDLDIIVNNIDAPAVIYQNTTAGKPGVHAVEVTAKGTSQNLFALGSRLILFDGAETRTYEKYPVRGFMSSMEVSLVAGLPGGKADSAFFVWPDNTYERLKLDSSTRKISLAYRIGLPLFDFSVLTKRIPPPATSATDITSTSGIDFRHQENHFIEFDREPLVPHMISTEGPSIAVGDLNGDGRDDLFLGASRDRKSVIYLQEASGKFSRSRQPALEADSMYEDVDAVFADFNKDGHPDLLVASGGNEFYGKDYHNTPRIYLNDGKSNFTKVLNAFDSLYVTASSVAVHDFNNDGFPDLFLGGRTVPWGYGQQPRSYLLQNDGNGHFKDVTQQYSPELSHAGLVTQGLWFDINKDGETDLLIAQEWGPITAYIRDNNKFTRKVLNDRSGWWNFLLPCDIDNDGDIDLVAGNLGLNSRLKASQEKPVRLYYNDFDDNGRGEQIVTYYLNGKEIPFSNKAELEKQIPILKKKFLYAADFAKATLTELLGESKLKSAQLFSADYFSNAVLINEGNLSFSLRALPFEAQLTSYRDAVVIDADGNALPDILLMGNFYENNIEMGRYDADYGTVLINKGAGGFEVQSLRDLPVKGQVRHIRKIRRGGKEAFVIVRNNDAAMLLELNTNRK